MMYSDDIICRKEWLKACRKEWLNDCILKPINYAQKCFDVLFDATIVKHLNALPPIPAIHLLGRLHYLLHC